MITDEQVEHVGRGLYIYWDDVKERCREKYSAKVRKVLESMPPHPIERQAVTVEMIERALAANNVPSTEYSREAMRDSIVAAIAAAPALGYAKPPMQGKIVPLYASPQAGEFVSVPKELLDRIFSYLDGRNNLLRHELEIAMDAAPAQPAHAELAEKLKNEAHWLDGQDCHAGMFEPSEEYVALPADYVDEIVKLMRQAADALSKAGETK